LGFDLHEFTILGDSQRALVATYRLEVPKFPAPEASPDNQVQSQGFREVDLGTGEVLFDWSPAQHIPVEDSYVGDGRDFGFDYLFVSPCNSILAMSADRIIVSVT
jgi:hypothetical protein